MAREGPFRDAMEGRAPMPAAAKTLGWKLLHIDPERGTGRLVGEGHVVHRGRSLCFDEGSLRTDGGELVATASATARLITRP